MKKLMFTLGLATMILFIGCEKDDDENGNGSGGCGSQYSCFECTDCEGPYGHLLNREYCVDGFDNCEDWETAKVNYETNDGCNCEYTQ